MIESHQQPFKAYIFIYKRLKALCFGGMFEKKILAFTDSITVCFTVIVFMRHRGHNVDYQDKRILNSSFVRTITMAANFCVV